MGVWKRKENVQKINKIIEYFKFISWIHYWDRRATQIISTLIQKVKGDHRVNSFVMKKIMNERK